MDHQKWFWRGIVGLIVSVMLLAVSHVGQYLGGEFFGAGIITVNTFEKAFVPEAGETVLTTTVELRDHDGRSAFQNTAAGAFAARIGTADAAINFESADVSTKITNSNGEVLRYMSNDGDIIGTFYLGVTETLATEVFTAFTAPAGDSINSLTSDGNNTVYAIINTPAVQPRLESFTVDFSTGLLTQTAVSTLLPGALPSFGEILFHNGILYYVNNTSLFTVTVSGNDFVYTDTGVTLAVATVVREFHGVTLNAAPRAGFDFLFIVDSFSFPQTVHAVQRTAGGVFSLFDLDTGGPNTFYTPTGSVVNSDDDYSFTVETEPPPASTVSYSDPLIVFVGTGNAICARNVITEVESCNDNAAAVFWVDTGRNLGTVLFETAGGVLTTTRFNNGGTADYTDAPFAAFAPGHSFVVFQDDFGVSGTFPDTPVWHQQALSTSGRIDTNPLFVGDGFRDVDITGNLISSNPVVMNIFWGQDGGAFPGVPDSTVIVPGPFVVNLSGTHVDSRAGDIFRFDFPAGNEFLISNIQVTAKINTDSAFVFRNCYVQDALGNTPVEVTVIDVEGDVGAVTVDGNAAVCAANICTADVPAIPVGVYPLTFAAVATDGRGNVSNGVSPTNIRVLANGQSCGGGRRIVGPLGGNTPPVILVGAPEPLVVFAGEKIRFDVSGIDEDEGNTLRLFFLEDPTRQFADGFRSTFKTLQTDAQIVKSAFEWQTQEGGEGSYDFRFEVVDNTSLRSEKVFRIDVVPMPPPEAPEYALTLEVSSLEDQYAGVISLESRVSALKGLEQVPRNFAPEDYPVVFERCIRSTGVNYSEVIDCKSVSLSDPSRPIDLSSLSDFSGEYYLPTTVRTFAFQAHLEIFSAVNEDAPRFLYEASSPLIIWKPELIIQDSLGAAVQSPLNLTSYDELRVSSRWRDVQFTLDGRRARNRLEQASVDSSGFLPFQSNEGAVFYEWTVPLGLEGRLCIRLFQEERCFDLFLPEDKQVEPLPESPVPEPTPERKTPDQYVYPQHRIRVLEGTDEVMTVFATVDPYRGEEVLSVLPQDLDIRLIPVGFLMEEVEVERRSGYPSVSVLIPRGGKLDIEFLARFDEGPYVYHKERVETTGAQEIVRGMDEITPFARQVEKIEKESPEPRSQGFVQISDEIALKIPSQKFSPSGVTLHGVAQFDTLKICLLDMQSGQIIEGNTIEVNPNGSFYGQMANEKLPQGKYTSVPFADVTRPCSQLMQSWFLLDKKDPHPFVLEVSDDLLSINVLQYAWSGTAKTAIDPLDFKAYDLTGVRDFLVDVDISSPYEYRSELYVEILDSGFERTVPLQALSSARLSVHVPGLNYGLHKMLVYAVLETGEKTPDVVIPFEYTPEGAIVLHGAAAEFSWLWIVLLVALVMMLVVWKLGGAEEQEEEGGQFSELSEFSQTQDNVLDEFPDEENVKELGERESEKPDSHKGEK